MLVSRTKTALMVQLETVISYFPGNFVAHFVAQWPEIRQKQQNRPEKDGS